MAIFVSPTVTKTATPSITLLAQDDFNDGSLGTDLWHGFECKQGTADEHDGTVNFNLPLNTISSWERCILQGPKTVESSEVRKISLRVTLTDGNDLGRIGFFSSWEEGYLNFLVSTEGVSLGGDPVEQIWLENFSSPVLPITRTLTVEWTGNQSRYTIVDSGIQQSIPATEPPLWFWFGTGANNGGYVNGAIDDIQVWGDRP